jgi:hypothetical protein
MLKIPEPNQKRASQGCCAAPLKNGLRIFNIPGNGSHCADHHQRHRIARYFTRVVFPFVMAGTKSKFLASRQKNPKCLPGGAWCMQALDLLFRCIFLRATWVGLCLGVLNPVFQLLRVGVWPLSLYLTSWYKFVLWGGWISVAPIINNSKLYIIGPVK